ncbi:hypothetical protein BMS3Abin05_00588 [bacterium BMS3Abin05]|nr:hypothetical protein BMS3Abin05_00588 [bacterium BMS3Abin05]GBE26417.1 hypothetical protein BMS3Bbin03_00330 [bacterium BMS3Bbin03]HDZ11044.1 GWxTD domain-containing protein [Bacteroidota bacterium]
MRKNILSAVLTLFVLLGLNLPASFAQPEFVYRQDAGVPVFYYDISNFAADSAGLSRMYINMKVSNDVLQFLKIENGFEAEYEFSVVILNKDGDQVEGKSFRRKAIVHRYEETNSNQIYQLQHLQFDLLPGKYDVILALTDMDTKKSSQRKEKIKLRNFRKEALSVSDILFVERKNVDSMNVSDLSPQVRESISDTSKIMFAYLEVYSPKAFDTYKIKYAILNFRKKRLLQKKIEIPKTGWRTKIFLPIDIGDLGMARYRLKLDVRGGKKRQKVERFFQVRNFRVPLTITNLDEAIDQLQYIAGKKEIDKLRHAPENKKQAYFEAFWKAKDPTPGTATNEVEDEYYRRIDFANQHFSGFRAGWKTDMGMVYILFGPPNEVQRQPYNVEASPFYETEIYAYEVWYYYDINRRFIFADRQGFGDYRLENPMAVYEPY